MKVNKINTAILIVVLVCLTTLGAIPIINHNSFWEYSDFALPGFFLLALAVTLFYVQHERFLMKLISILVAIGLPLIVLATVEFVI